jgi:hypothetical protein
MVEKVVVAVGGVKILMASLYCQKMGLMDLAAVVEVVVRILEGLSLVAVGMAL